MHHQSQHFFLSWIISLNWKFFVNQIYRTVSRISICIFELLVNNSSSIKISNLYKPVAVVINSFGSIPISIFALSFGSVYIQGRTGPSGYMELPYGPFCKCTEIIDMIKIYIIVNVRNFDFSLPRENFRFSPLSRVACQIFRLYMVYFDYQSASVYIRAIQSRSVFQSICHCSQCMCC